MARYCCPRCYSELTCLAVFLAINPARIRCACCDYQVRVSWTHVSAVVIPLVIVVIALVCVLMFFEVTVMAGGLALVCLGVLAACLYTAGLNAGLVSSDLILIEGAVSSLWRAEAYDLDTLIPEDWRVDSDAEERTYKASSPDGNQVVFIKHLPCYSVQTMESWIDESRRTLLSTRYCPALNNFTMMNDRVCHDKGRGNLVLDGYDHDNAYRLVTQYTRCEDGTMCVSLHQFSCQSYSVACSDAVFVFPVMCSR